LTVDEPQPQPERRVIYRGRKIDLALQQVRLSDGSLKEREIVVHRGAVALVPMVDDHHVCLLQNFRFAVDTNLIEVPAGTIDPGETPDSTAPRELTEETGYRAGRITRVTDWYVSPGVMTERMYLYLCEDLTPGPTEHQPDEQLRPFVVPWDEAVRMALDGRIRDAKSILAILVCNARRNAQSR
jgi:ADP-ribose pyrophosphatase